MSKLAFCPYTDTTCEFNPAIMLKATSGVMSV